MKHLLPLTYKQDRQHHYSLHTKHGNMLVFGIGSKKQAEFLATAANAHYPMLEALEDIEQTLHLAMPHLPGGHNSVLGLARRDIDTIQAAIAQAKP